MENIAQLSEYVVNFDKYLAIVIDKFGLFTYILLFLIIFAETGLVILPFLPGDSLLFISGTLAGSGYLNIVAVYITFLLAAIIGDTVNYHIGKHLGPRAFKNPNSKIFKQEYLDKTVSFYDRHGGKTIMLARFFPLLRTFAPFVAGIGHMHYPKFLMYNAIGATIWVTLFTLAGYFFGSLDIVQEYFHVAVFGMILISLIPAGFEFVRYKYKKPDKKTHHTSITDLEKTFKKEHLND